jgi:hypothetical protein
MRAISLCLLLLSFDAFAGATNRKAVNKRSQASDLVNEVIAGNANPNTIVNRVKHLGEESYAAHELGSLMVKEPDLEKRRVMAQVLSGLSHPQGEAGLIAALNDDDGPVRMYAAQGLGRMRSKSAAPRLAMALADKTLGVRRDAARALGLIGDPKHAPVLSRAVKAEDDPETRAAMLLAIGQSGDKKQIPVLETFLANSSESARFGAAAGLCVLGAPSGQKFARTMLASKDRYERMQGLMLFDGSRAKAAAPVLEPLLKDPDRSLQAAAARILYQGGDKSKLDWLVLTSFQALGEDRLPYEKELETLRLPDDERRAILRKAGIK